MLYDLNTVLQNQLSRNTMETHRESKQLLVTKLYDAALEGNVDSLLNLLQQDPLILDRCIIEKSDRYTQSPLHVVANFGHLEFTKALLHHNPSKNSKMCLAKDQYGRNPVHVAATSGDLDVLNVLLSASPLAARERTSDGDTVLHLCVKHTQPSALEYLGQSIADSDLLNSKDSAGNTVLHLAVLAKHLQMVQYLLANPGTEKNAMNTNGLTAMDILNRNKKGGDTGDIWRTLKRSKTLTAREAQLKSIATSESSNRNYDWLDRQRNALMIVASLIATMAFQVGVNPPGGAWQDGSRIADQAAPAHALSPATDASQNDHVVGTAILATLDSGQYHQVLISSTIGLLASLSVIVLLISGLPCKRTFVFVLMVVMWIAVTATIYTFFFSVRFLAITMEYQGRSVGEKVIGIAFLIWAALILLLLIGHGIRAIRKPVKRFIFSPILNLLKLIIKSTVRAYRRARSDTPPV